MRTFSNLKFSWLELNSPNTLSPFLFNITIQAHIRELEEEVRLLKNLSHPNIVASGILLVFDS